VNSRHQPTSEVGLRVFLIASVVVAMAALIVAAGRVAENRNTAAENFPAAMLQLSDERIPAEADVFRTHAGVLAIDPASDSRRSAHPRTLATYRSLRAYPGAPPRIPHGLTPDEFHTGGCNTCHERGGFSQRFGAYVPITPHPEMGACLQCHVGDGELMAISLPTTDPSARCRQCHTPGAGRWTEATLDWKTLAWPQLARDGPGGEPPPIPHALDSRGNCVACHGGPAGVEEIRTAHPERANCRQCHVTGNASTDVFVRPARQLADDQEGKS
jgi:cytochrome c-type protein NapB